MYRDINQGPEVLGRVVTFWAGRHSFQLDVNLCSKLFRSLIKVTPIVKLRDFQFRLLRNKIFCNNVLYHWKKSDTQICDLCKKSKQDIIQLMYKCPVVRPIWSHLQAVFWKAGIICNFEPQTVILNLVHDDIEHIINKVTLIVKQFIYRSKCQGSRPNYMGAVSEIKLNFYIEQNIAIRKLSKKKFVNTWSPICPIFDLKC